MTFTKTDIRALSMKAAVAIDHASRCSESRICPAVEIMARLIGETLSYPKRLNHLRRGKK